MNKNRALRFGFSTVLWAVLLIAAIAVLCTATSKNIPSQAPDLTQIQSRHILPENQKLFETPGSGYLLTCSDGNAKTNIIQLAETSSGWQATLLQTLYPAYQQALESDHFLYLFFTVLDYAAEGSGTEAPAVQIVRYDYLESELESRIIRDSACDFRRECRVEPGGKLFLVTAQAPEQIGNETPVSLYLFDGSEYTLTASATFPQFPEPAESIPPPGESSSVPSEMPSSTPPEASSSQPSESSKPDSGSLEANYYIFPKPLTVSALEASYAEHAYSEVCVIDANNVRKQKGQIVTGDIIEVTVRGTLDSRIIACIQGDLTARGKPGLSDVQLLYEYLTNECYLGDAALVAADLTGDGCLDTGDLLLLKEKIYQPK